MKRAALVTAAAGMAALALPAAQATASPASTEEATLGGFAARSIATPIRVEVWEPPKRLALTWRLTNFTPEQQTRVDVRFASAAGGTRVSVTHSGWDAIPAGHPARHDLSDRAFVLFRGHWWAEQLTAVKRHAERSRTAAGKETP